VACQPRGWLNDDDGGMGGMMRRQGHHQSGDGGGTKLGGQPQTGGGQWCDVTAGGKRDRRGQATEGGVDGRQ
jgi:hypothetical protein